MKKIQEFVALDLETTWLDAKKDKIIEIAIVKFDIESFEIIDEYATIVDPEIPIPSLNSSITWIFDADVREAPKWREILLEVSEFIGDSPIVWHNVFFDIGFLLEKWVSIEDNMVLDTFLIANFLVLWEKSLSLEYLCKYFEIDLLWAHRALNDTKASIKLLEVLIKKILKLPKYKQDIFWYVLEKSTDSWMNYIAKHILPNQDSTISKDDFLKLFEKCIPKFPKKIKIETVSSKSDFAFSEYINKESLKEKRVNQEKMWNIVYTTMKDQKFSVVDAPTWIGKTYAYLIPSVFHSIHSWEQVFVSTTTKTLQDQIFYKDLESLQNESWMKFSYAKLKWKRNYISIASFVHFFESDEHYSLQKTSFLLKILMWMSFTAHWELDELEYYGQEFSFLYEINADDLYTFSKENVYLDSEFAVQARRQSRKANIVVINNNILFQDLDQEGAILSKVENLVLDEAHNLEDVLTQSLQKSFCLEDLEKSFWRLEKKLLSEKQWIPQLSLIQEKILFELALVFDMCRDYLYQKVSASSKYKTSLLKKDFFQWVWQKIQKWQNSQKIQILFIEYFDLLQSLDDKVYNLISREIAHLELCLDVLSVCLYESSSENYICYTQESWSKWIVLEYTLLHPWVYLKKHLWTKLSSCLLTSATIKIWESFEYIQNMLCLENFDLYSLKTDFDYKKQALLFVPNDIGSIKNNEIAIIQFLWDFMKIVGGKTLFLCTSFHMIQQVFSWLERDLHKEGISMYAQSIGWWKKKLIDAFEEHAENSLLVGTNTFWEWVDIPWEKLQYLIIHKIPFMVPTDPIFQARAALFDDQFQDYAIPKAVLKLKQWFWRLIRKKDDSWIVVFLDDRIYSTWWGQEIYGAFPTDMKKKIASSENFFSILKNFKK